MSVEHLRTCIRYRLIFLGRLACLAGALLLTSALSHRAYAQVDTGGILGTVKDQSGGVLPNAKVTLTNEETSYSIFTTTGADGTYTFTPVKIGNYSVAAEYSGFRRATHPHVTLNVQQQVVVDFSLEPGAVTQTIEVTAEVPLLQTTNASIGRVVDTKSMNNLPLNGRNFTFLAQLMAGVTFGQQDGRGLNASGSFASNGTRPAQNNYLLDGIDNNIDVVDFLNGTAFVVLPSLDAVQEFKIQTTDYSAEIGRAGGAVLNATIKSGTNTIHGDFWEFLRHDRLDAADFFQNATAKAGQAQKGKFRQNQFGFTVGGPVYIPHLYNGKNRTFFFGDYQGTRIRQAVPKVGTVPTLAERNSGYTDFSDLRAGQSGTKGPDPLGRSFAIGTIFDPATTRGPFTAGQVDPVTGAVVLSSNKFPCSATSPCFVRDPFSSNKVLPDRLNSNVIKLFNLYPSPTNSSLFDNFVTSPVRRENVNSFDVRVDQNFSEHDTMFARVSYYDDPQFKPGPFANILDGGEFNDGDQIATSRNAALSETHAFSPTTINEARLGFSGIHTGRLQPFGNDLSNTPGQFGIQGVPQVPQNGGLPEISIGRLSRVGAKAFLVSDEFNSTVQATENLTKIYKAHTFKGGFEFQHIKFSTLQPPFARGAYNFGGNYTSIPSIVDDSTGRVQMLLKPVPATVPSGVLGGPQDVRISNIANTDDGHNYYGGYFQDDWKITPKLTLNLGLRWDFFGQVEENFGAQANFVPGAPFSGAKYLIPVERQNDPLSQSFKDTLKKDGIDLVYTNNFALGNSQKTNFSPRVGFAYQATPKLVVRGGYGIFYGGFENRGFSPNIGENYPFQFDFRFQNDNDWSPAVLPDGSFATFENSYSRIPLDPTLVKGSGLSLRGIQFDYITPYTQGYNLTLQYQLTPNNSFDIGYVATLARHLEVHPGSNTVALLLPKGTSEVNFVPYRDFNRGSSYSFTGASSYYHSLQAKFTRRFAAGLDFGAAYTYAKGMSDAADLLNGGSIGYRNPWLPGFGIQGDYGLADADIRNVFHFGGGYQLPVGRGRHFLSDSSGVVNHLLGGWAMHSTLTLQNGQPQTVGCTTGTSAGSSCVAFLVPGRDRNARTQRTLNYYNPAAFADPPQVTAVGQTDYTPLGGKRAQVVGPGFHHLDFSLFKEFRTSERTHLEFRTEVFNLTNTPNFSQPGSLGDFNDPTKFAKITSTRDNPNDPRQIQFALKFYW